MSDLQIDQISQKLLAYLKDELDNSTLDYDSPLTQLQGGFETRIYRFKLNGVQQELARPLVLRLYPQFYGTGNAVWESTAQSVLVGQGYPVAQAHFVCTDMSILGGAFFIMDFLPGKPMISQAETVPQVLGKTHAALHSIDPEPLIQSLRERGIDKNTYRLSRRFDWLKDRADKLLWIRDGADWLIENRPPEPERLVVCHGDFHPLNILVQDGKVTGVLDWPNFVIADPAFDVANTILLTTIPFKHIASMLEQDLSFVDWEMAAEMYLAAYRSHRPLDGAHLDYYKVRRSVDALIQGFEGQKVWQHPLIVRDLIEYIHKITQIRITMPLG